MLSDKPALTHHDCCFSPRSPFLSGGAQVPSFFLFLHPREQWKNWSPALGLRDAFLLGESQTTSTTGPGIFTGGHILGREKRVSCQLGEWEGEAFLSFLEKRGSHLQACYFGSSVRECHQTGPCPKDISQQGQLVFAKTLQHLPLLSVSPDLSQCSPGNFFPYAVGLGNNGKPTTPSCTPPCGLFLCCLMKQLHNMLYQVLVCCHVWSSTPDSSWRWGVLSMVS